MRILVREDKRQSYAGRVLQITELKASFFWHNDCSCVHSYRIGKNRREYQKQWKLHLFCGLESHSSKDFGGFPPSRVSGMVRPDISLLLPKGFHGKFGGSHTTANNACVCLSQTILPRADGGCPELFLTFQLNGCSPPMSQQRRWEGMRAGWVWVRGTNA